MLKYDLKHVFQDIQNIHSVKPTGNCFKKANKLFIIAGLFLVIPVFTSAQFQAKPIQQTVASVNNMNAATGMFIENIGQYGQTVTGYEAFGVVKYGYEGLEMPVLFTEKGIIHL